MTDFGAVNRNANFDTNLDFPKLPLEQIYVNRALGLFTPVTAAPIEFKPKQYIPKLPQRHLNTSYITPVNTAISKGTLEALPIKSSKSSKPLISSSKPVIYTNQQDFIKAMLPYATKVGQQLGVDPYMIIAQSAHETGWGKHALDFNYFGIKGNGSSKPTREYLNGQWVTVNTPFKGYASMEDSVNGYRDFLLRNTRYQKALQAQDAMGFLQGLYDAGYATDPNYVSKVGSIYHKIRGV